MGYPAGRRREGPAGTGAVRLTPDAGREGLMKIRKRLPILVAAARPGQHNPDSSEDPWGGGLPTLHGGASARNRPDTERDIRGYDGMHEGRKQTNTWSAYAGSRLELSDALGRRRPKRHPSSRTGENPPYGMIGGIEETSASFEARSAPRSYPTAGGAQ